MSDNFTSKKFEKLLQIVTRLRSPDGCPWDKKQTPQTMKPYLLEESHELAEAIDSDNADHVKEELGDLFFQLTLISRMYEEKNLFDVSDALQAIVDKMIRRHPHVFDNKSFSSPEELRQNWLKVKAAEKKDDKAPSGNLDVPKSLPALNRAQKVAHRAVQSGFSLCDSSEMKTLPAKATLLSHAVENKDIQQVNALLGELLFMIADIGRSFNIYCEDLLHETTTQFVNRYHRMEKLIHKETGNDLCEVDSETKEQYWDRSQENI